MAATQKSIYDKYGRLTQQYSVNSSGKIIEKNFYSYINNVAYLSEKDTYSSTGVITQKNNYDSSGHVIKTVVYNSSGVVNKSYVMTYVSGNLASTCAYNAIGQVVGYNTYNADTTISNKYTYSNGVLTGRTAYKYDNNKTLIEMDYFNASGVVTAKDYLTNGVLAERDYIKSGIIVGKNLYTNGVLTEQDYITNSVITEKDYVYGGKVAEKDFFNSKGVITERDYLNTSGVVTEKDLYTNGVLSERDYLTNGLVATKYFLSNGNTTEIDKLDTKGKLISKSLYSNNILTEADFYTSGTLYEKDYYTNNTKTSSDFYSGGVLSARAYYTNNVMTEKDLYSNGVIKEKDFYTSNSVTEKDYYNNNILAEKDYLTNGVVTKKDYYDNKGNLIINTGTLSIDPNGNKVYEYGQATLWSKYLDYAQGDNSKGYKYDCGLAACENVLIEAGALAKRTISTIVKGIDTIESIVVNYAAANGYCITSNSNPYYNGGTYGSWQAKILAHFGVFATDQYTTLAGIASAIKNNSCVIVEVDAYKLWGIGAAGYANHAITVTGVDYSAASPTQIDGFYICDSGRGSASDAARFVSTSLMSSIFNLTNYNGQMVGEAVITDAYDKQVLDSGATSVIAASGSAIGTFDNNIDINKIIQQMSSFQTGADQQAITCMDTDTQSQNLQTLVASHAA